MGSRILRVGVSVPLHPHVDVTWGGAALSRARVRYRKIPKCLPGVVAGAVRLRFLGPDDRRIIMFDSDGEWWRVEAQRGHGPHGASRRRARSPAERVRARPEVDLMINRGRDGMVNAGAVSEGFSKESSSGSSCAVQTHGGDRSHGHRILTAHDAEIFFTWCARPGRRSAFIKKTFCAALV